MVKPSFLWVMVIHYMVLQIQHESPMSSSTPVAQELDSFARLGAESVRVQESDVDVVGRFTVAAGLWGVPNTVVTLLLIFGQTTTLG